MRARIETYIKLDPGCGGKPAGTVSDQNRMTIDSTFAGCADRLKQFMARHVGQPSLTQPELDADFNSLAVEWFEVQYQHNQAYRQWCQSLKVEPGTISDWKKIPAMPAAAFKEVDATSFPVHERTHVFHSSGTTQQRPSRHFHNAHSLTLYEASLLNGFQRSLLGDGQGRFRLLSLTPTGREMPHSSLVHMFETLLREVGAAGSAFHGFLNEEGAWELETQALEGTLEQAAEPVFLVGTAFSYVNWIDSLVARDVRLQLPPGSRVMETGGYKGRSRSLPKEELHALIGDRLGIPAEAIICEYGMSELSSQAYDVWPGEKGGRRVFHFPPWARPLIVSPESGLEVRDGETGLVRIVDLANLWSVSAVQTEDLAVRRGTGFELIGRLLNAEPRGCSLMAASQ